MKAVVAAFNQEKALVGAFSVITNLRMELFQALVERCRAAAAGGGGGMIMLQYGDQYPALIDISTQHTACMLGTSVQMTSCCPDITIS